jgi:hypothetical protein
VEGNEVKITVNLKQNKTIKSRFEVKGNKNELQKLASNVVEKATSELK